MLNILAVALGGGVGAVLRFGVHEMTVRWLGQPGFPWATLAVNLVGCVLLGTSVAFLATRPEVRPEIRLAITVGLLGALTTFSTFALDAVFLWRDGRSIAAGVYVLLSNAGGLSGLLLGARLAGGFPAT